MLVAWGANNHGECCTGESGSETEKRPKFVTATIRASLGWGANVVAVACGEAHTLILTQCGNVFACGRAREGQLGLDLLPSIAAVHQPTAVEELRQHHVLWVACGMKHSLAVTSEGRAFEWGLLLPTEQDDVRDVWAHGRHGLGKDFEEDLNERERRIVAESWSMYLKNDDISPDRELDDADALTLMRVHEQQRIRRRLPRECLGVEDQEVCVAVCGFGHTILAVADGNLLTAGYNEKGQLGRGSRMPSARFERVLLPGGVLLNSLAAKARGLLATGLNHTAAVVGEANQVITWGLGTFGQLGLGHESKEALSPAFIKGVDAAAAQIACGDHHTLVLTVQGDLFASGHRDAVGGRSHQERRFERLAGLGDSFGRHIERLFAGGMGSFGLVESAGDGLNAELYAWGYNQRHQLGRADFDARELKRPMPTAMPQLAGCALRKFGPGARHCLAVLESPTISVLPLEAEEPPATSSQLLGALRNGTACDVRVITRAKDPLSAHRCILTLRAPALAARLRPAGEAWELDLSFHSAACAAALLEYLYCDFCLALPSTAAELLPLAEELGLSRLAAGSAAAVQTVSADNEGRWVRTAGRRWIRLEAGPDVQAAAAPAPSTFLADMFALVREGPWEEPDSGYVALSVQEFEGDRTTQPVFVARPLLLSIEFFRALLEDGFAESAGASSGCFEVSAECAAALVICLRLLASGDWGLVPQSVEQVLSLLVEAHRLCLAEIVDIAEFVLGAKVDAGEVAEEERATLRYAAELYSLQKLQRKLGAGHSFEADAVEGVAADVQEFCPPPRR